MIRSRMWPAVPLSLALGLAALVSTLGSARTEERDDAALRVIPVGRYDFASPEREDPHLTPEELSGITRLRGNQYLACSDEHGCLHRLTIEVDPASGGIRSASIGNPIPLRDARGNPVSDDSLGPDREGIALTDDGRSVWIANERSGRDESRSSIALHRLSDGHLLRSVRAGEPSFLPGFEKQRPNLGFESLARALDGSGYWTANEGPLAGDGARATSSHDATVRLLKLNRNMQPKAQFAYTVDRFGTAITGPPFLVRKDLSGLSDLLALPGGRLLALERCFSGDSSGFANLRIRIYGVNLEGATDVSGLPALQGREFTPARKRLLWEDNFGLTNSNFEGMALGPKLTNGDRALILIADNNGGTSQALYALRLHGAGRIPDR